MNIDRQKIIEWSKYNLVFLKYQRTIDTLKNAQPGEALPKNIALNTAQFANFFGELIEKFKIVCVELERVDKLERIAKIYEDMINHLTSGIMELESKLKSVGGGRRNEQKNQKMLCKFICATSWSV